MAATSRHGLAVSWEESKSTSRGGTVASRPCHGSRCGCAGRSPLRRPSWSGSYDPNPASYRPTRLGRPTELASRYGARFGTSPEDSRSRRVCVRLVGAKSPRGSRGLPPGGVCRGQGLPCDGRRIASRQLRSGWLRGSSRTRYHGERRLAWRPGKLAKVRSRLDRLARLRRIAMGSSCWVCRFQLADSSLLPLLHVFQCTHGIIFVVGVVASWLVALAVPAHYNYPLLPISVSLEAVGPNVLSLVVGHGLLPCGWFGFLLECEVLPTTAAGCKLLFNGKFKVFDKPLRHNGLRRPIFSRFRTWRPWRTAIGVQLDN